MSKPDTNDAFLDDLFAEARQAAQRDAGPAPDLMARILADADAVQASFADQDARATRHKPSIWAALGEAIGGWPALAGLAAAGVAGVWIGVAPPQALSYDMASVLGQDADFAVAALEGDSAFLETFSTFDEEAE